MALRAFRDHPETLHPPGVEGNIRLTTLTAAVLLVLLAVQGFTLLAIQNLLAVHIVVGLILFPVTLLKLASTGYRMLRYYAGSRAYVAAGPPWLPMRLLAPVVVVLTILLYGTGLALLWVTPGHSFLVTVHKAVFVLWFCAMALHVLVYIWPMPSRLAAEFQRRGAMLRGPLVRLGMVAASLLAGGFMAATLLHLATAWLSWVVTVPGGGQ